MKNGDYVPPAQSALGQFFDSMFFLALVVRRLFAPLYFGLAGGGKTRLEFADKTRGRAWVRTPSCRRGGRSSATRPRRPHDMIVSRFDYSFDLTALSVTALVVIVYFVFVFRLSAKEYRDVIAERFGRRTGRRRASMPEIARSITSSCSNTRLGHLAPCSVCGCCST